MGNHNEMLKMMYLYWVLGMVKPKPYPALPFCDLAYTLQVKLIVGCVVAVVVVGCPNDFEPSAFKLFLNSKAVLRSSLNLVFFINLILIEFSVALTDCISKIHLHYGFPITYMITNGITW